jgi:SNF2 family DNA or RNA helicase
MRSGKTKATIDKACYWYWDLQVDGVVVVAPNNVHRNWLTVELPKHHWTSLKYAAMAWITSDSHEVDFNRRFDEFCSRDDRLRWFMINQEALASDRARKYLGQFARSCGGLFLVVDEGHEFRGASSKRANALLALSRSSKTRAKMVLTANPWDNSPLHCFVPFEVLRPGWSGFSKFSDFEDRYGVREEIYTRGFLRKDGTRSSPRRRLTITGTRDLEDMRSRYADMVSLVTRADIPDMSDLLVGNYEFELTEVQRRMHNELVSGMLSRLNDGDIVPPSEGSALLTRLQQLASGWVKDEFEVVREVVSDECNPRLQALMEVVNNCGGKFIVWCRFREDVRRVTKYLIKCGVPSVHYYGGTTSRQRIAHEKSFKTDTRCLGLVGQFEAGGQGLDFSVADDIVWYSHTTNLLKRRQADERASNQGRSAVSVTNLVAVGSNDLRMLSVMDERLLTANFMGGAGLRQYLNLIP